MPDSAAAPAASAAAPAASAAAPAAAAAAPAAGSALPQMSLNLQQEVSRKLLCKSRSILFLFLLLLSLVGRIRPTAGVAQPSRAHHFASATRLCMNL